MVQSTQMDNVLRTWYGVLRSVFDTERPTLYFHSPCFDGVASAVITADFLETHERWPQVTLHPVNYNRKDDWLAQRLGRRAAVVDFLFHPDARFWADHHPTTFGPRPPDDSNKDGSFKLFDPTAPSCASLLQSTLEKHYRYRNNLYEPLVWSATKIDTASYESVDEAIFSDAAALRINLAFQVADDEYPKQLVSQLRTSPLDAVASMPTTDAHFRHARSLLQQGLERVRVTARMSQDGIVTFDVSKDGVVFNRYAPYLFFPEALYSVGITRSERRLSVTAMRNPWKEFEPVNLGRLFGAFGGGGHRRVGSVSFEGEGAETRAQDVRESVVASLRNSLSDRRRAGAGAAHA